MNEGVGVGEGTSRVRPRANKENEEGASGPDDSAGRGKEMVSFSAQGGDWASQMLQSLKEDNFRPPFTLSSTVRPYHRSLDTSTATTPGVGAGASPVLEAADLDVTIGSMSSFASDFGRRRRRRREQLALENPAEGERQRKDLERALQSLEEMQRENRERMRIVASYAPSTRVRSPNEKSSSGSERRLLHYFRTQSAGSLPFCKESRGRALKRLMTSSAMPEPNMTTPMPLPRRQERINFSLCDTPSPPQHRRVDHPSTKISETQTQATCENINSLRKEHRSWASMSRVIKFEREPSEIVGKSPSPPRANPSPPLRTPVGNQGVGSGSRDGPVNGRDGFGHVQSALGAGGNRCASAVPGEGNVTRGEPNDGKQADKVKTPTPGRGGRSTSPPIIILTVDSRRSMGEEDARRLLSAEPIKSPEPLLRRTPPGPTGRSAGNNPPKKQFAEAMLRSSTMKELPSAATEGVIKENSQPECKKARAAIPKSSLPGAGAAAPVVAIDKSRVEERHEGQRQPGALNKRPLVGKSRNSVEAPSFTEVAAKKSTSVINRNSVVVPTSKQRKAKSGNGTSKITVVVSGETKTKTQPKPEPRSAGAVRSPVAVAGRTATASTRYRVTGISTRAAPLRRDDPATLDERGVCRGKKSTSPPYSLETASSVSKQNSLRQIPRGRKSPSSFTLITPLERESYRPLGNDRPIETPLRAVRRGPVGEPYSPRRLVPFCTECGKKHLSEKVKFCAFCGHKREAVAM
ncbi:hypothetical protein C3747_68g186 [Trypanosoma cruzi]|uniref:Zinc-ribbon domain-containing protein n=2 Tax=Trypanosoma cruzi TaxID=5693 RepID=Q4DMY0_TRYCC|nr:hypothetical protein, conserved [Trypanosoma cruzi]EAN93882.1 hypothetical protein, conserved [Trypanosoma cruzi]PWV10499.1 hypothetical protein C3747_68g186 [Trypanosoma cruzi]RNC61384.1 hypothetical protein TcCL_ESM00890 [Trypanosoma cruzi]|eukprot:XP_815733.1 hypothetical protein [Trypanosoma cruzi strain CL Brener]